MNKEQIEKIKEGCKTDLRFLCTHVLKMNLWDDTLHNDMAKWLKESGPEKLILLPRGHLKSSIITVGYTIQQILINPNIRILITNAKLAQAGEYLSQISDYLTFNSLLPKIFGEFKDEKKGRWTLEEITIAQKNDPSKRGPTIRIGGPDTALTGSHCDLLIHDDIVGPTNIGTGDQLEKIKSFYRNSRSLLDTGRVILVGTRWNTNDLYGEILNTATKTVNRKEIKPGEAGAWLNCIVN